MPKMYFAEFKRTEPFEKFEKFGHTGKNDAMIRLRRIIEEHPEFEVRVLAAVYHHSVEFCQGIEEAYKEMYPKNFWLEEKISGVTEIVKLDTATRNKIIRNLRNLNEKTKKALFPNENSARSSS